MERASELKFTHTRVFARDGKPYVSVMFERGTDVAEGTIPECSISKSTGFTKDEIEELQDYLKEHREEIIENARRISTLKRMF